MQLSNKSIWIIMFGLLPFVLQAQHHHIMGTVRGMELHESHGDIIPLFGAEIFWLNTNIGTTTDKDGHFHLEKPEQPPFVLVFRYVEFENTAAVDVGYSDAVSGAKRIKMLGLAGYYTQILVEKNP